MATGKIQKIFSSDSRDTSNLNNAIVTGLYSFTMDASNAPIALAGNMLVINGTAVITQIVAAGNRLFVRRYAASSGWNDWAEK